MRALIIFNLFFLSVGCSTAPISIQSDNVIEKIAELRPGTSTRNDVASLLGSPDIETPIDNTELQLWYGVRTSHGINVPQVIVGLDPTSQKMQWIWNLFLK